LIAINELLLQVINASSVALHYTGLEMRFLDLCGFPDPMTSTTVKDVYNILLSCDALTIIGRIIIDQREEDQFLLENGCGAL